VSCDFSDLANLVPSVGRVNYVVVTLYLGVTLIYKLTAIKAVMMEYAFYVYCP
jgi:hypothetical protein